jgi:hypothetical protein
VDAALQPHCARKWPRQYCRIYRNHIYCIMSTKIPRGIFDVARLARALEPKVAAIDVKLWQAELGWRVVPAQAELCPTLTKGCCVMPNSGGFRLTVSRVWRRYPGRRSLAPPCPRFARCCHSGGASAFPGIWPTRTSYRRCRCRRLRNRWYQTKRSRRWLSDRGPGLGPNRRFDRRYPGQLDCGFRPVRCNSC